MLTSDASGQVDPQRTWVVTGRERHVGHAREENLTYPHRALRTGEFLYIRNFHPERWPMGNPRDITATYAPSQEALENETYAAFPDMDASPTKAWLVAQPQRYAVEEVLTTTPSASIRPRNCTTCVKTPDQVTNVPTIRLTLPKRWSLRTRLTAILLKAKDPRVVPPGDTF